MQLVADFQGSEGQVPVHFTPEFPDTVYSSIFPENFLEFNFVDDMR